MRGWTWLADLAQDARVAVRSLPKQPAFLAATVLTLAVGIAGGVAMLTVLDASLVRPLPYPEADRLVLGRSTFGGELGPYVSAQDFEDYRDRTVGLAALGAIAPFPSRTTVTGAGAAERIDLVVVSPDFFPALGVDPIVGRHFLEVEGTAEGEPVVMLSYGYWQRRFGGDRGVVGMRLTFGGVPHTVIGVMPANFRFYLDTDAWRPFTLGRDYATGRRFHNFFLVGRLAQGATLAQVQAAADAVSHALQMEYPDSNEDKALLLTPLHETLVERYVSTLRILAVAAVLILLVASANVTGLLLARGHARRTEMAVRSAMGAGRGRLARQLMVESALLAGAGGILGLLLGALAASGIRGFVSLDTLGAIETGLSARTLAMALVLAAATSLIAGLPPAIGATRTDLSDDLRSGNRTSAGAGATHLRDGLVITQIALTTLLLAISGLLLRSFVEVRRVDLGFDPHSMVTAEVQVPSAWEPARRLAFFDELKTRLESVPGVTAVAVASHLPVRDPGSTYSIERTDATDVEELRNTTASQRLVMPGYFEAMGIALLAGRGIEATDRRDGERVIVLSESTARYLFGEESAIGRTVRSDGERGIVPWTVVGVAADVVLGNPAAGRDLALYVPHTQLLRMRMRLAVRVRGDTEAVVGQMRSLLREMDPDVPLDDVRTMDQVVARSVADRKGTMAVLIVFAATALILAGVGLYGVLAYRVSLRLREIGIRMALGASSLTVTAAVVRNGLTLVVVGLAIGAMAALAVGRVMQGMLFAIDGNDPITFAALVLVLSGAGALACTLPARRASRVSPTDVIRAE